MNSNNYSEAHTPQWQNGSTLAQTPNEFQAAYLQATNFQREQMKTKTIGQFLETEVTGYDVIAHHPAADGGD